MDTKILGLRTTIYNVSDLGQAKSWYTKAFDSKPYFDEPFYVGFNIGGYELGLLPIEGKNKNKPSGVFAYWGVNDIESVYKKLIELGAIEHEAPNNVGDEIMVATVKDPWQNIIGIIYNPDFTLKD
jgi:predicted enzyme related to lactoylglutathione lyase